MTARAAPRLHRPRQVLSELRRVVVKLQHAADDATDDEQRWCFRTAETIERAIAEGDSIVRREVIRPLARRRSRQSFTGNEYD